MSDPIDDVEYTLDLDHTQWLPVPLTYPWNGYSGPEAWARDAAPALLQGTDAPADAIAALADYALTVATVEGPFPGAIERFWFVGGPDGVHPLAHLYVAPYADTGEAAARAVATAGAGGYVQVLEPIDGAGIEDAWRSVVIVDPERDPSRFPVVMRAVGFVAGAVFIVEVAEDDWADLLLVRDPMVELFRAISVRRTTGSVAAD